MKLETLSSLPSGVFAGVSSWLLVNGSSFPVLCMALVGAVIAVLDLVDPTLKRAGTLIVFNTAIGTFGGPVLLISVGLPPEDLGPAALLLVPFLLGWAGHSAITDLWALGKNLLAKRLGGQAK